MTTEQQLLKQHAQIHRHGRAVFGSFPVVRTGMEVGAGMAFMTIDVQPNVIVGMAAIGRDDVAHEAIREHEAAETSANRMLRRWR